MTARPKRDNASGQAGGVGKTRSNKRSHSNPIGDLFPELLPPVAAARWPNRGTRNDEAMQALLTGPQNQADYWRGWRLAAYVKELEYNGWAFLKRDILRPGCRREITEYELDRTNPGTAAALASRQNGFVTGEFLNLLWVISSLANAAMWLIWWPQ